MFVTVVTIKCYCCYSVAVVVCGAHGRPSVSVLVELQFGLLTKLCLGWTVIDRV